MNVLSFELLFYAFSVILLFPWRACLQIYSEYHDNFVKVSSRYATTQGLPYSYSSIMHYAADAFAINDTLTIVPLDNTIPIESLGQNTEATALDYRHMNVLYCGGNET